MFLTFGSMITQYPDILKFDIASGGGFTTDENGDRVPVDPVLTSYEFKCRAETPKANQRKTIDGVLIDSTYVVFGIVGIPRLMINQDISITFPDGFIFNGTVKYQNKGQLNTTTWV